MEDRIIGAFGGAGSGAMVLAFGAMHGNEPAGVQALHAVFNMLEAESRKAGFQFQGKLIGVIGNLRAYSAGQRFIAHDLNRYWTPANLQLNRLQCRTNQTEGFSAEDWEMAELLDFFQAEISATKPDTVIVLDLHTTSAQGGIFCIPADDAPSLRLAKELHAPVLLGMLQGLEGTMLHYTSGGRFVFGGFPNHAIGVAFEAGQHNDPRSVSRATDAVLHCLRASGCLPEDAFKDHPDALLQDSRSGKLPRVTRLRYVHHIHPNTQFHMRPGYVNFQPIEKGEHLADDDTGPILSPLDGLILMPLYQPRGSDGFFVVEEIRDK